MFLLVLLRLIIPSPLLENFFPPSSARCWDTHQSECSEGARPLGNEPKMMLNLFVQGTLKILAVEALAALTLSGAHADGKRWSVSLHRGVVTPLGLYFYPDF